MTPRTEQTPHALTASRQHDLSQRCTTGEPAKPEGNQRRKAASTDDDGESNCTNTTPGRPEQSVTEQLLGSLAPRQYRGDRHQEQQGDPDRYPQPIEEW
jgi:hypothetical protein